MTTRTGRLAPASTLAIAAMVALAGTTVGCDGSTMEVEGTPDGGAPPGYVGTLPGTTTQYRLVRGRGAQAGQPVPPEAFLGELAAADAVCLGESHSDPEAHGSQRLALERLMQPGANRALGLEMFNMQFQSVLDEYAAGEIEDAALLSRTQWRTRWGFDFSFYRPQVRTAVDARAGLLALNMTDEIVRRVGRDGLAALTAEERALLPELDLGNVEHRAWFMRVGVHNPGATAQQVDNMYTAQVLRDETMADISWRWLAARKGQVAIMAGVGHCIDPGIPARLRRRGAARVLSVKPVPEGEAAEALQEGWSDFLVVFPRDADDVP